VSNSLTGGEPQAERDWARQPRRSKVSFYNLPPRTDGMANSMYSLARDARVSPGGGRKEV
jgi:hypothetical protein